MNFEEYLKSKKIDPDRFRRAESALYAEWNSIFETMHPDSFTAQKLFLINPIRRKFTLKEEQVKETRKPQAKPKIITKPKK